MAGDRKLFSFRARGRSFVYAFAGLRFMLVAEHNARIHLTIAAGTVAAAALLGLSLSDWRWILFAILWVWFAEAMNTAFEYVCNVVSPGANDNVRVAKDVAAGGVLLSAIGAASIGIFTFAPYIVRLIG